MQDTEQKLDDNYLAELEPLITKNLHDFLYNVRKPLLEFGLALTLELIVGYLMAYLACFTVKNLGKEKAQCLKTDIEEQVRSQTMRSFDMFAENKLQILKCDRKKVLTLEKAAGNIFWDTLETVELMSEILVDVIQSVLEEYRPGKSAMMPSPLNPVITACVVESVKSSINKYGCVPMVYQTAVRIGWIIGFFTYIRGIKAKALSSCMRHLMPTAMEKYLKLFSKQK